MERMDRMDLSEYDPDTKMVTNLQGVAVCQNCLATILGTLQAVQQMMDAEEHKEMVRQARSSVVAAQNTVNALYDVVLTQISERLHSNGSTE